MAGNFRQLFRVTLDASASILVTARNPVEAVDRACTHTDYKTYNIIRVEKDGELWEPDMEAKSE